MKEFNKTASQGDLMLKRINKLPEGLTAKKPGKDGLHIVAHSETGHHHTIPAKTWKGASRTVLSISYTKGSLLVLYPTPAFRSIFPLPTNLIITRLNVDGLMLVKRPVMS